ncbi:hypothetical protein FRC98_13115 [Lujinxingia vulgaris]|uniref:Type II secretion system protein GspE N-terminal domain-containing protein n=1 Tax=Lujinxingia vulgaris TaxID=2600176 RepID=A0A5C6X737_9DELT|nr:hypothetical protein [Lujinxingia vulgaris]TXD36060.1 hypothetical protein FRC98_13115 [Lujinxingia vulgaris]
MIDDAQLIPQLLAAGLVDQTRLQHGLRLAQRDAASLYDVLIFHKIVDESALVEIASNLLNVPCLHLEETAIDVEMAHLVPAPIAQRSRTLPVRFVDDDGNRVLLLAMADPIDVMAMDEIASHTGVNIRPVLVGPADLRRALDDLYARAESESLPKSTTVEHHSGLFAAFDQPDDHAAAEDEDPIIDLGDPIDEPAPLIETGAQATPDDSWAAFFDNARDLGAEESSVISQEMRDRPPTDMFEVVEEDLDELDEDLGFGAEPLPSLLEESVGTSVGYPQPLDEWELDDDFDSPAPLANKDDRSHAPPGFAVDRSEANRTQIGVGLRGLGLDFAEPPDEDVMPLHTMDVELLSIEEELNEPESEIPPLPPSEVEDLEDPEDPEDPEEPAALEEPADADQADASEASPQPESSAAKPALSLKEKLALKPPSSARSIRDALTGSAAKTADEPELDASDAGEVHPADASEADEREGVSKLGRIQVKRIAVPRFGGAIEKRSDLDARRADASGEPEAAKSPEACDDALDADEPTARLAIPDDVDAALLARAALTLLVEHNLVSPEEIHALIEKLRR